MRNVSHLVTHLPDPFVRSDAHSVGITDEVLERLVRRGEVVRARRGVFCRPRTGPEHYGDDYVRRIRAAALAFGPCYAVSHLSAAAVLGLPLPLGAPGAVHLTRLAPCHRSRQSGRGVVIHHADSCVTAAQLVGDLLVTAVDRTLADCMRTLPLTSSVPVADAALHRQMTTTPAVREHLESHRRWVGMPRARLALDLTDGRRESWFESFSFVRLDKLGVAVPTPQVLVRDEWGLDVGRVDGMWEDSGTVAEADGRGKYRKQTEGEVGPDAAADAAADAVVREKVREDDLRGLGLEVVRWGLSDLLHRPWWLVRRIEATRARGNRSRFRGSLAYLPKP